MTLKTCIFPVQGSQVRQDFICDWMLVLLYTKIVC